MPITPSYEWREAETSLSVDVRIRAVTASSADILMTDCYAKVNCAPFFFEADLYGEIDPRRSSASVGQDTIKFFFIKKEQGLWGRLTLPGDRKLIIERRNRSLAAVREEAHKNREDFPAKLSNIGRLAVGEQMKLEEARRKTIELKKNEELRTEQEGLKRWMASGGRQSITHSDAGNTLKKPFPEVHKETPELSTRTDSRREDRGIVEECHQLDSRSSTCGIIESFTKPRDTYRQTTAETWLPAPRRSSSIPVNFSSKPDRPVHLPARESRDTVRLKKKETGSADASNPTEREPLFLQDKADKFFRCGDYHGAINAYTSALEADPSLLLSITNRAACKMHLRNYEDCRSDCFRAMRILQHVMAAGDLATSPPTEFLGSSASPGHRPPSSAEQISFSGLGLLTCLKAHAVGEDPGRWEASIKKHVLLLQGTANYHEGKLQQALEDYMQALRFEPTHEELQHIVGHIKRLLETNRW